MNRTDIARNTLAQLTVAELRDLAREAGIAGRSRLRKAELVAALLPIQVAEQAEVATRRTAAEADRATTDAARHWDPRLGARLVAAEAPAPADNFFAHTSAVHMHEMQEAWEEAEGEVAQSAAWEDYIDACYEAGLCGELDCEAEAVDTDDEHRCPIHLRGAALGDDVAEPTDAEEPCPARVAATPAQDAEQLDLAVRGLRQGGWAAHSARELLSARAAGRRADLDSLTERLRRDLAS